ncbi:hypothetical protein Patl1_04226 [Pistacia atlantica]|uniref:Uncharacterized protein n=1 Tax=Pistacia atlantica TaxID=434234 RepID=A0ACC1BRW8_9ROSI|nr:hypothetical protein Patl1_04226 [Pistacia atlantica]
MEEQQGEDKPRETGDHGLVVDQILVPESSGEITIKDDFAVENHMAQDEFTMEDLSHGEQIREPGVGIVVDQTLFMDSLERVREAFKTEDVVRLDCSYAGTSDCKKIGVKLRDLVPCVPILFKDEQIILWRGKKDQPLDSNASMDLTSQ